ncbi:MAG: shikimate kinase [Saprospirales bacterium]|nr:shikimate kinase [Saprospirales bacterium]MBK8492297.1 shikimate kinase [Saprospirales bacterium]
MFTNPSPIFLIGMMGSGKSTVGEQLAQLLGWPFIDLDSWIEDQHQCTIAELFARDGENGFRLLEREALLQVLAYPEVCVIACGGGTPCFFDNMHLMKEKGWVIYLRTPFPVLLARLEKQVSERPLLSTGKWTDNLEELLVKRSAYYEQAHIVFEQRKEDMPVAEDIYQHLIQIK